MMSSSSSTPRSSSAFRDESLEDLDDLPSPDVLAREIVEDLTAAVVEFETVAASLEAQLGTAD